MKKICKPKRSKYRGNREKSESPEAKCVISSALFTVIAAAGFRITMFNVLMLSLKAFVHTITGLKGLMQRFMRLT